jgi:hypothetical protein
VFLQVSAVLLLSRPPPSQNSFSQAFTHQQVSLGFCQLGMPVRPLSARDGAIIGREDGLKSTESVARDKRFAGGEAYVLIVLGHRGVMQTLPYTPPGSSLYVGADGTRSASNQGWGVKMVMPLGQRREGRKFHCATLYSLSLNALYATGGDV